MSIETNQANSVEITVLNKLIKERRDINVYHHSNKSAHILSWNNSFTYGVKPVEEDDYLHISVVSGPGYLKHYCILDFPSFLDFKFSLTGEEMILFHSGERMLLRVPPWPLSHQIGIACGGKGAPKNRH